MISNTFHTPSYNAPLIIPVILRSKDIFSTSVVSFQYNESSVMEFSFILLRIKSLYMFPALLAYP
jgi:hypothetical protein